MHISNFYIENYEYKFTSISKYDLEKIDFPKSNDKIVKIIDIEKNPTIKILTWNDIKNYKSNSCNIDLLIFEESIDINKLFDLIKIFIVENIFRLLHELDDSCRLKNKEYDEFVIIKDANTNDELKNKLANIDFISNKEIFKLKNLLNKFTIDKNIVLTENIVFDLDTYEIKNFFY